MAEEFVKVNVNTKSSAGLTKDNGNEHQDAQTQLRVVECEVV